MKSSIAPFHIICCCCFLHSYFITAGLAAEWWDNWMLAALDGTGKFSDLSRTKRVTCSGKGDVSFMTLHASHEIEIAAMVTITTKSTIC